MIIDRNKCILCGRCVRACAEVQNRDVWNFAQRGFKTRLVAGADQFMLDANCESCGQCVAYCPVGALYDKMSLGLGRPNQVSKVRTTCSYCGVGCTFDVLSGLLPRAPRWMQRYGLEWLYRLRRQPLHLWKRYLIHDMPVLLRLLAFALGRKSPRERWRHLLRGADES